jgi:hypothetical protein
MMLSDFERDLVDWYAAHAPHPAVAAQLGLAVASARRFTGAGMTLELNVPQDCERIPGGVKRPIDGPQISSPAIPGGAGSILWHDDGRLTEIEVYTFDAVFWEAPSEYWLESG